MPTPDQIAAYVSTKTTEAQALRQRIGTLQQQAERAQKHKAAATDADTDAEVVIHHDGGRIVIRGPHAKEIAAVMLLSATALFDAIDITDPV